MAYLELSSGNSPSRFDPDFKMGRDYAQNLYNRDGHLCCAMDGRLQRIGHE
jgi:hypothetical protein